MFENKFLTESLIKTKLKELPIKFQQNQKCISWHQQGLLLTKLRKLWWQSLANLWRDCRTERPLTLAYYGIGSLAGLNSHNISVGLKAFCNSYEDRLKVVSKCSNLNTKFWNCVFRKLVKFHNILIGASTQLIDYFCKTKSE